MFHQIPRRQSDVVSRRQSLHSRLHRKSQSLEQILKPLTKDDIVEGLQRFNYVISMDPVVIKVFAKIFDVFLFDLNNVTGGMVDKLFEIIKVCESVSVNRGGKTQKKGGSSRKKGLVSGIWETISTIVLILVCLYLAYLFVLFLRFDQGHYNNLLINLCQTDFIKTNYKRLPENKTELLEHCFKLYEEDPKRYGTFHYLKKMHNVEYFINFFKQNKHWFIVLGPEIIQLYQKQGILEKISSVFLLIGTTGSATYKLYKLMYSTKKTPSRNLQIGDVDVVPQIANVDVVPQIANDAYTEIASKRQSSIHATRRRFSQNHKFPLSDSNEVDED